MANDGNDGGAYVVTKPDGIWTCVITTLNGSRYEGVVHGVVTPSGKRNTTCNAKLVSGPGLDKLERWDWVDITITPGGTALWKDVIGGPGPFWP